MSIVFLVWSHCWNLEYLSQQWNLNGSRIAEALVKLWKISVKLPLNISDTVTSAPFCLQTSSKKLHQHVCLHLRQHRNEPGKLFSQSVFWWHSRCPLYWGHELPPVFLQVGITIYCGGAHPLACSKVSSLGTWNRGFDLFPAAWEDAQRTALGCWQGQMACPWCWSGWVLQENSARQGLHPDP